MHPLEFEKYLQSPELLEKSNIEELQQLVSDFPYFQAAHMLLTVAGKKHDARVFQQSLRKTAIVSSSRTRLFELVQQVEKYQTRPVEAPTSAKEKVEMVLPLELTEEAESQQELDILKAAELSTEVSDKEIEAELKHDLKAEAEFLSELNLEPEIAKQVVNAFVEKEIIQTTDLHKPILREEPESFGDWLSYLKKNNGQSYSEIRGEVNKAKAKKEQATEADYLKTADAPEERREKNKAIIDRIIESNPGHIRGKEEPKFYAPDLKAKESLLENEHLVTETLARIYALQGSVNKAIRAYEILSLKYPQKSAYFASLIQKLKHN